MIPIRSDYVRWVILAIAILIAAIWHQFSPHVGVRAFLGFLLVLTAMSWIVPPGIYGWLVRPTCPTCGARVEWTAVQPNGRPYDEQIVIRCHGCNQSKIEWEYRS